MKATIKENGRTENANLQTTEVVRHDYWVSRRRHTYTSTRLRVL